VDVIKIKYAKIALKALNKYDAPTRRFIREKIRGLTETPPVGDIKLMQGYSDGRLRLRTGKYRIVYKYNIEKNIKSLHIIEIDSRGGIYK
jgi:mRNA interferase RelE/StbE